MRYEWHASAAPYRSYRRCRSKYQDRPRKHLDAEARVHLTLYRCFVQAGRCLWPGNVGGGSKPGRYCGLRNFRDMALICGR